VRRISLLAGLLAVAVMPAAAVAAGPAGFSDPEPIGTRDAGQTAAAASADGHAAIAWAEFGGGNAVVHVALRNGANRPWRTTDVEVGTAGMRDLQAAITTRGDTILAWTGFDRRTRHAAVAVVAAPLRGRFGAVRRVAIGNGFAAFTRLAVLRSGTVVLALRDGPLPRGTARLRVRVRPAASTARSTLGSSTAAAVPGPPGWRSRAAPARRSASRARPRAERSCHGSGPARRTGPGRSSRASWSAGRSRPARCGPRRASRSRGPPP
jgi:hypothetical protein